MVVVLVEIELITDDPLFSKVSFTSCIMPLLSSACVFKAKLNIEFLLHLMPAYIGKFSSSKPKQNVKANLGKKRQHLKDVHLRALP